MKKLLFLILIALSWSCKRQNDMLPSKSVTNAGKPQVQSGGDGTWDLLGYGLDVTGDLLNTSSVSDVPIFDIQKFAADNIGRIDVNATTEGTEKYYSGVSALEYMNDVSSTKSFGASGNVTIEGSQKSTDPTAKGNANFTGSFTKNSSDQNRDTYSTRYSYATYEISQRVKRIRFTGDVTMALLMQYLTPDFINNVATKSADELVARYGTHVMLDISIGGRLKFNYSGALLTDIDYTKRTSGVKAGLGFTLLKVAGININSDKTNEQVSQITATTSSKEYSVKFYGGTNSGRTISIDKDGNTSETINIGSWQQSVSATNAALLDVGNALYLYDFISDPDKKAQVKAAIEKHINDKQITLAPQEVYEFSTPLLNKHANNLDPNMHLKFLSDGWHPNGQPFKAYSYSYNGAVPIYQLGSTTSADRILSPNRNPGANFTSYGGIIFYAYASQVQGTVPVYQFRQVNNNPDHYYSTIKTPYDSAWALDGIAFWAFPN